MRSSTLLAAAAALVSPAMAAYQMKENFFDNEGFFGHFDFWDQADPTHGLVQFVNEQEARSEGLINSTSNSAWMGADSKTVLTGNQGRKATRITSKKSYTHMLVVVQLNKIPVSCGSWPAFWTVGPNWPNEGEIDIVEGVNTDGANRMTLHTSGGCSANGQAGGLLKPTVTNCQGNQGCGFTESSDDSWQNVDQVGGGVWAMEWTSKGISMWWWGGNNKAPQNVLTENPDPSSWGKPSMNVADGSNCDIDSHFKSQQIVFDWTFCGDWAGSPDVWGASQCAKKASTCQQFVQNNPKEYEGKGFDVRYLKVFQDDGKAASGNSGATPASSNAAPSSVAPAASSAAATGGNKGSQQKGGNNGGKNDAVAAVSGQNGGPIVEKQEAATTVVQHRQRRRYQPTELPQ